MVRIATADWRSHSFVTRMRNAPRIQRLVRYVRFVKYQAKVVGEMRGTDPRWCLICGETGYFRAFGRNPRLNAQCPSCDSLERHRLMALLLQQTPQLARGRVIHFAPEPAITKILRSHAEHYSSADIVAGRADLVLNLENLSLPDGQVDLFVLSHVLEHVEDKSALRELFRCLRPGGAALIMVPIIEAWPITYENPSIQTPQERASHFGQHDHLRYYGRDLRERIAQAGFTVSEFTVSGADAHRYNLDRGSTVFIATKPQDAYR